MSKLRKKLMNHFLQLDNLLKLHNKQTTPPSTPIKHIPSPVKATVERTSTESGIAVVAVVAVGATEADEGRGAWRLSTLSPFLSERGWGLNILLTFLSGIRAPNQGDRALATKKTTSNVTGTFSQCDIVCHPGAFRPEPTPVARPKAILEVLGTAPLMKLARKLSSTKSHPGQQTQK